MKRLWYEWVKLCSNRILLAAVLFCLAVTLVYQWRSAKEEHPLFETHAYEEVLSQVRNRDTGEAMAWAERETAWYRYLTELAYFGADDEAFADELFHQMKESYPDINWEERLEEEMGRGWDSEKLLEKSLIYEDVTARVRYLESYPEFLETVQKQADSMLELALFSEMDTFSEKNIKKTAQVYEKLKGQPLGLWYSDAPVVWSESTLADVMVLALILLLGWQVFCREREEGLYPLLLGTKNGRVPLAASKVGAYVTVLAVTALLIYGGQILLAFGMYGVREVGLPLASLPDFRDCPYEVSIAEYTGLYLGIKVFGVLAFGSVCMAFLNYYRYGVAVCLYIAVAVLEYLLYIRLDSASGLNSLKYLNLAAILDTKAWFDTYRNLNIFSNPCSLMPGKWIAGGICLVLTVLLSVRGFCRQGRRRILLSGKPWRKLQINMFSRLPHWRLGTNLFFHEGYKLYWLGGMLLTLLILSAGSIHLADGIPQQSGGMERRAYIYYLERIKGPYIQETEDFLRDEEDVMAMRDEEALAMEQGYASGSVSEQEYTEWSEQRQRLIQARGKGLERVLGQEQIILQTLQEGYVEGMVGFADVDQLSYLFEDDNRQAVYAILFLAVSSLGISILFGMEYQGMQPLLESTVRGRRILSIHKLLQSLLFATVMYLILYLPYYLAIWRDLERVEPGLLLKGVMGYEAFPCPFTIGQAFFVMIGVRYMTAMSCVLAAAGITRIGHRAALGSGLCFLLFLVPCFLYLMGVDVSGWTCVGGFLPELVYRNGKAAAFVGKSVFVLGMDAAIVIWMLRERSRGCGTGASVGRFRGQ